MRKSQFITLIFLMIIIISLSGCNNKTVTKGINITCNKDDYFEIETDVFMKNINEVKEKNEILNTINSMRLKPVEYNLNEEEKKNETLYCIRLKDEENKTKNTIIFNGKIIKYKNTWYDTYNKNIIGLSNLFNKIYDMKIIDEIKAKRKEREITSLNKALNGYWIDKYGNEIYFDDTHLKQQVKGSKDKSKYKSFKYKVEEIKTNFIHISLHTTKGLFIKGKKIGDMYITMDKNKCNMIVEKVIGDITSNINRIYIEKDTEQTLKLGNLKSDFFKDSKHKDIIRN